MRCPSCAETVEAGAAVCPHCDHVLDAAIGADLPSASDAARERTPAGPPRERPTSRASGPQRALRGKSGVRPLPGSQPLPADDSTQANSDDRPAPGRRPLALDEPTNASPTPTAEVKVTRDDVPAVATAQIPALRDEEDSTDQRPALDLPDEPAPPPSKARAGARGFAARAAPEDASADDEGGSTARDVAAASSRPAPRQPDLKVAPPQQKAGKQVMPARRGSGMTKALSLGKLDAVDAPPVDPETFFRNLGHTLLGLPVPEKIEVGSAMAMAVMLFMPWQTTNSRANPDDDTIGLATWGGFWALLFVGGAMGLFYLRHTGRLPALTPKLLSLGEALLSALTVPMTLVFILLSIKEHPVKSGLGVVTTRWASLPAFGSILGLLCGVGICAGAVMCFQRHRHDPA